jgi:hypothetical protein
MMGYAVGAWTKMGRPKKYTVHIAYVYLESKEVTSFDVTAEDMEAWIKELDALPEHYVVNRRCIYCSLNASCKTFSTYLRGSVNVMMAMVNSGDMSKIRFSQLDEKKRAQLATAMKMSKMATERVRDYIKDEALRTGKDISAGNGNKFIIRMRNNRSLLTAKALPILAKYVTTKDLAKATNLSLNSLLTAASARVKGPMRGIIRNEITERLEKAGAIVVTESPYLETVNEKGKKSWPTKKSNPKKK